MRTFSAIVVIAFLIALGSAVLCPAQTGYRFGLNGLPDSYKADVRTETDTSALVFVQDGYGRAVKGLDMSSFTVQRTDGRPGRITHVFPLDETPLVDLRVVLVIDNSKSMLPRLDRVLADMDSLIAQLGDEAEISVVSFSSQPLILGGQALNVRTSPFLRNKNKVRQIYTDIMRNKMTYSTYLYDAVYAASTMLQEKPTMVRGREVKTFVILFSDGNDIGSEVSSDQALAQVYTGGSAPVFFTVDYFKRPNSFLRSLATKTGGVYYAAKQDGRLQDILSTVARDTYSLGYRVLFDWRFPPSILITANPTEMQMQSTTMNEAFPLLAYVFFDEASSDIPARYQMITQEQAAEFSTSSLPPDAFTYYYNLLNIIGSRLHAQPKANITITGCNANTGGETGNTTLSQARAEVVADYLRTVWDIAPERIKTEARNLPAMPSRNTDEDARGENRRVEISSDDWEIVKPVIFRKTTYAVQPSDSISIARARVEADGGIRESSWKLLHHDTVLWTAGATPDLTAPELRLNWQEILSEYTPTENDTLELALLAVSRMGDSAVESVSIIPHVVRDTGLMRTDKDKISLILFDFNKADVTSYNTRILREFVLPRVYPGSAVVVKGYTDNVGNLETNINLAEKRAQAVGAMIRASTSAGKLSMHGIGELTPLFSNLLPEGRLYNRTVVIYIDTPVE